MSVPNAIQCEAHIHHILLNQNQTLRAHQKEFNSISGKLTTSTFEHTTSTFDHNINHNNNINNEIKFD